MAKILIGIVAVLACFYLAESLTCNKCSASVLGFCLFNTTETCSTNTSVCYTTECTFPGVSSSSGFSKQGCSESSICSSNTTTTINGTLGTLLGLSYSIKTQCCSTDKCNPVNLNGGATSNSMSLSVALSVAALAAVWGSYM